MQFEILAAIVEEENKQKCIDIARTFGAGGVTILKGNALGLKEKKTFFGLSLEANVNVLLFILPKKISVSIFKKLKEEFVDEQEDDKALIFIFPISHIAGIKMDELELFEDGVQDFL